MEHSRPTDSQPSTLQKQADHYKGAFPNLQSQKMTSPSSGSRPSSLHESTAPKRKQAHQCKLQRASCRHLEWAHVDDLWSTFYEALLKAGQCKEKQILSDGGEPNAHEAVHCSSAKPASTRKIHSSNFRIFDFLGCSRSPGL